MEKEAEESKDKNRKAESIAKMAKKYLEEIDKKELEEATHMSEN